MRRGLVLLISQWFSYGTLVRIIARNERYRELCSLWIVRRGPLFAAASLI